VTASREHRVAVVVATRNRVGELLATLQRLADLPERPQIVVVDNGSFDGTAAAVRQRFPEVELVELVENLGGAARTVGVARVHTPYVAFCDDDSWWAPGSLRLAADLLDASPRLALLAGRILVGEEERLDPVCVLMAASPLPADPDAPGPALLGFVACGAVVRRTAFLQVGGFHPRLLVGGEEELLALDLASAGWQLAYVDEVVAHHHPSLSRDLAQRRAREVRNTLWVGWLRRPAATALRRTVRAVRAAAEDPHARRGLLAAARGAAWVLAGRRVIPPDLERRARLLET
jgi:GT2 family glycosyltransferase